MFLHIGVKLKSKETGETVEIAKQQSLTGGKWFVVRRGDFGRWYTEADIGQLFEEIQDE